MEDNNLEKLIEVCRESIEDGRKSEALNYLNRIRENAMTDSVMGIPNRKYFDENDDLRKHIEDYTIAMMDIDNLKDMNTRYGHIITDYLLSNVGSTLKKYIRNTDIVARYAGDEIVIILPEIDKESAHKVLDKLRRKIQRGSEGKVTVSIGYASSDEIKTKDFDTLIKKADKALFIGKESGKNKIVMATEHT